MKLVRPLALGVLLSLSAPLAGAQGVSPAASIDRTAALLPGQTIELAAGEWQELTLKAPFATRDFALWYEGQFDHVEVELLSGERPLAAWPLVEDQDQAPEHFDPAALLTRPAGARHVTGLAHSYAGPADAARLLIFGPARLKALEAVWIAPGKTLTKPAIAPPAAKAGSYPKPFVYSRSSWNADPAQCSSGYCTTTHMAIHHTASSADYAASTWSQAAANVKAIQAYHMYTNGWCDVGYNYLVTKEGWIFEGRGGGDDVKGAHDGFNCGSMGVASLGYFHTPVNNPPTTAQLDALEELGAWKCDQQNIDPLGSSWYAGYGGVKENIYGHRDVKSTACPGDLLYAKLGEIRSGINARLSGTPTSGTLKGVLYDANLGTTHRLVGTVALSNGSFVKTASDGYFEFPLPAGTYQFAGTAAGHNAADATETVTSGDVWESLGLWQASVPAHTNTSLSSSLFNATFSGDVGSPVWLGYSGLPGIPTAPFGLAGSLWVDLPTSQVLYLGTIPGSGTLSVNLTVSGAPLGTTLFTQGYLLSGGQARLTNGAAWISQ